MPPKLSGTVKSFINEEGFGWIDGDDARLYFVRFFDIEMEGYKTLVASQRVQFEVDSDAVGDNGSAVAVKVCISE